MFGMRATTVMLAMSLAIAPDASAGSRCFGIHVIDDVTGRGVPLAYLRTTFKATYVTDSNGYVAFYEPGLMDGQDVWFDVQSFGYDGPKGPLGASGVALKPRAGEVAEVKLTRRNIAERLYRMTGFGIYRDAALLGLKPPLPQPLLNARVAGSDTVQTAVYRGKYYWFWQDTDQVAFPLGNFNMTGATASALPGQIDVDRGIDFTYFADKPGGFARAMSDVPRTGSHPIWIDGFIVTRDRAGDERMIARYAVPDANMSPLEQGLVIFDDARQTLVRLKQFGGDGASTLAPNGRPFRFHDGGQAYVGFVDGVRVRDTFEAASDPDAYEVFTCVKAGSTPPVVDRADDGRVRWHWQQGGGRLDDAAAKRLLQRDERRWQLRDVETGKPIEFASGSIAWNEHLRRWTLLFGQQGGDTMLGELWFAVAASPLGPWREARKVATHAMKGNDYTCYNPIQHEDLARDGGRYVYFEGTFANTFSGNGHPTAYYDYNNVMYRIDVNDTRLELPVPPAGLVDVMP